MKQTAILTFLLALSFAFAVTAQTGNTKHFAKDGLSFDYPDGWTVTDDSTTDAQQLTLSRSDNPAMIKFFVHRGKVNTPEKLAQAKTKIIDPYVTFTEKQFTQMGATPKRADATTQIAGANAEGVHITAVLEGEAGEAGIYWAPVGERLVVLTLFGPDKALKKVQPSWDQIRNSLKIEANAKATPSPKQP